MITAQNKDIYLASKPRYEILDGLRGVAAIMVILFHCLETYIPVFSSSLPRARTFRSSQMTWAAPHQNSPAWHHVMLNIGLVFLSISIAWALFKLYDEPVRAWLKKKLFSSSSK